MILPIVAYGSPVLRKRAEEVTKEYPGLGKLLDDMWETMYYSNGVGIAAPQVNKSLRIFMVDSLQIIENLDDDEKNEYPGDHGIKQVFINPEVIEFNGKEWPYNEGCLSIPKIREDVIRPGEVKLRWVNENFEPMESTFNGITARVIQHEYDHLEGKLFIDYLSPLKRRLLKGKLLDISKGKVKMDYRLIHPMN
ncbi:MAG: peptide deformylase [Chitinophagaceae bacterium]|jgi:peptide deformylase|nr:peptide deformylase [Chitinophagaceae bacterium]